MDPGAITAVLVAAGGLAGAVAAAAIALWNTRHKNRLESESAAVAHFQGLVARQQEDLDRLEAHSKEQQRAVEQLYQEHTQCQVEIAELYGYCQLLHDFAARSAAALRRAGQDPGETPPLPPRPRRSGAAEYIARTTSQNASLLARPPQAPPESTQ